MPATETLDVLIVGAGLSGICAATHLTRGLPGLRYAIAEARDAIGGTWDLFRYPGVRSDSDMYTLGYSFKPWASPKAIADGDSIRAYVREAAREGGIEPHIRFGHRVVSADWSGADSLWTVQLERGPAREPLVLRCNFLFMCAGYYRYDAGYLPDFPGVAQYRGQLVHPQAWTPAVQWAGRRVVVIGSGATAVTLLPELARDAAHVTMLQRSPTWMVARPSHDALADWTLRHLPSRLAYGINRWKRVLLGLFVYRMCQRRPEKVERLLMSEVRQALGPDYDIQTHFKPRYRPWNQRLCLVPDGDLFQAIRSGKASVVTDTIDTFTPAGIRLASGRELEADLVVTATGLNLQLVGGTRLSVDGQPVDLSRTLSYKGLMYSGVPNLANCTGYTNASWTLKCDLTCAYVTRLLRFMRRKGHSQCVACNDDPSVTPEPWVDFSSGYIQRSLHLFPKQGSRRPWKLHQNYPRDILMLRFGRLQDGVLRFGRAGAPA